MINTSFPRLTNSEKELMELLWDAEKPLTSSEIVTRSTECSWKPSYVHLLINSLLKKEMIEVAGFTQATKNYARTFQPTVTREAYARAQILSDSASDRSMSAFVAAFVDHVVDEEVIEELSKKLEQRKKELEAENQKKEQEK